MGLPNCTRSLAYAAVISSTRAAPPSSSADVATAPRSSTARARSGPPSRMAGRGVEVEPAQDLGQIHGRLGDGRPAAASSTP